jgi:hypothetical protein
VGQNRADERRDSRSGRDENTLAQVENIENKRQEKHKSEEESEEREERKMKEAEDGAAGAASRVRREQELRRAQEMGEGDRHQNDQRHHQQPPPPRRRHDLKSHQHTDTHNARPRRELSGTDDADAPPPPLSSTTKEHIARIKEQAERKAELYGKSKDRSHEQHRHEQQESSSSSQQQSSSAAVDKSSSEEEAGRRAIEKLMEERKVRLSNTVTKSVAVGENALGRFPLMVIRGLPDTSNTITKPPMMWSTMMLQLINKKNNNISYMISTNSQMNKIYNGICL